MTPEQHKEINRKIYDVLEILIDASRPGKIDLTLSLAEDDSILYTSYGNDGAITEITIGIGEDAE